MVGIEQRLESGDRQIRFSAIDELADEGAQSIPALKKIAKGGVRESVSSYDLYDQAYALQKLKELGGNSARYVKEFLQKNQTEESLDIYLPLDTDEDISSYSELVPMKREISTFHNASGELAYYLEYATHDLDYRQEKVIDALTIYLALSDGDLYLFLRQKFGLEFNGNHMAAAHNPEQSLKEYLAKAFPERPRLLVEGINTDDLKTVMRTPYGVDYIKNMLIPEGERCVYILEEKYWQGTNGSEDISDQIVDYLIFRKTDLMSALEKALENADEHANCVVDMVGERIRDDGFWEDGSPCFKYTTLRDVHIMMTLSLDPANPIITIWSDSNIDTALHPYKHIADYDDVIF
jgi:hypothetical protein